jgi:hypothetical protein
MFANFSPRLRHVLVAALVLAGLSIMAPAHAAVTVTADFDDVASGTALTTQYQALGLSSFTANSRTLALAGRSACSSVSASNRAAGTTLPPSMPHYAYASSHTSPATFCATFAALQTSISMTTAEDVKVYGLTDRGGTLVPVDLGTHSRGSFTVTCGTVPCRDVLVTPTTATDLHLDDLTFAASGQPAPSVTAMAAGPLTMRDHYTGSLTFYVRYRFGAVRPASFALSGYGLTFTRTSQTNPDASTTKLVYTVASDTAVNTNQTVTLSAAGQAIGSVPVSVIEPYALKLTAGATTRDKAWWGIAESAAVPLSPCAPTPTTVSVTVPASDTPPLPAERLMVTNDSGQVLVSQPLPASGGTATYPLSWSAGSHLAAYVSGVPGGQSFGLGAWAQAVASSIDLVQEISYSKIDDTPRRSVPRWGLPGSQLRLTGKNLCFDGTIKVGNSNPVPVTGDPSDPDHAFVQVPFDATSGKSGLDLGLSLTSLNGKIALSYDKPLTIQVPRSTSGFQAANFSESAPFSDWYAVFGDRFVTCHVFFCEIDPVKYELWTKSFSKYGSGGNCFGFASLSSALESGWVSRNALADDGIVDAANNFTMTHGWELNDRLRAALRQGQLSQSSPSVKPAIVAEGSDYQVFANAFKTLPQDHDFWLGFWFDTNGGRGGHIVRITDWSVAANQIVLSAIDSNRPFRAGENHAISTERYVISNVDGKVSMNTVTWGKADSLNLWDPAKFPKPGTLELPNEFTAKPSGSGGFSASSTSSGTRLTSPHGRAVPGMTTGYRVGGMGFAEAPSFSGTSTLPLTVVLPPGTRPQAVSLTRGRASVTLSATGAQQLTVTADGTVTAPKGASRSLLITDAAHDSRTVDLAIPAGLALKVQHTANAFTILATRGSGKINLDLLGGRDPLRVRLGRLALGRGELHWVGWSLHRLETRMDSCRRTPPRGSRPHVATALRKRPLRCGWSGRCVPSWELSTAQCSGSQPSSGTAPSQFGPG